MNIYKIKKSILSWFGDIQVHKYPMFVIFGDAHYKIKGKQSRNILDCLKPGDVLLRHYDKYISSLFIPGYYDHAAIYVGDGMVSHAIAEGVILEDILSFIRCDDVMVLRAPDDIHEEASTYAAGRAVRFVEDKAEYDFDFDENTLNKIYCSELVYQCYKNFNEDIGMFIRESGFGKGTYVPEDLTKCNFKIVYDSKEDR